MNKSISNPSFSKADLAFRFTPGRLCLNLVATIGERGHRNIERLRSPDDLARWCVKAVILEQLPEVKHKELEQTKQLREAIYEVTEALLGCITPESKYIEIINYWASFPPTIPQLDLDGRTKKWTVNQPMEAVMSVIARDAIDLFGSSLVNKVKACANPNCQMLFLDTSRPGNRRWCSMTGSGCGNRAKKAAFRQREKRC